MALGEVVVIDAVVIGTYGRRGITGMVVNERRIRGGYGAELVFYDRYMPVVVLTAVVMVCV
jgi:hypothetical protein